MSRLRNKRRNAALEAKLAEEAAKADTEVEEFVEEVAIVKPKKKKAAKKEVVKEELTTDEEE